ncbi:hypothetical protein LTR53_007278 [Teratosphaeriaceae sp. CCFEE 6253]|nr:hypothetical protein LTR53_007278 [Teratosphaeriaceae sp. CCFEE 6253]
MSREGMYRMIPKNEKAKALYGILRSLQELCSLDASDTQATFRLSSGEDMLILQQVTEIDCFVYTSGKVIFGMSDPYKLALWEWSSTRYTSLDFATTFAPSLNATTRGANPTKAAIQIRTRSTAHQARAKKFAEKLGDNHAWTTRSHAACHKTIGTFELLESILLLTSMETVLFAQGVNRHFRTTITESPPLLRKVLLAPPLETTSSIQPRFNPLFIKPSFRRRVPIVHFKARDQNAAALSLQCWLAARHVEPRTPMVPVTSTVTSSGKPRLGRGEKCEVQWTFHDPGSACPSVPVWRGIVDGKVVLLGVKHMDHIVQEEYTMDDLLEMTDGPPGTWE